MNCSLCESPLWDKVSMWDTPDPSVTPCFEQTVMLIPCLFLWIFAPLELHFIKKSKLRCTCLEQTAMLLPRFWLWIRSPVELRYVKSSWSECPCRNWMNQIKLVSLDILVVCCLLEVVVGIGERYYWTNPFVNVIYVLSPFLQLITFVLAFYLVHLNTRRGLRSSGIVLLFWLLCVIWGATHLCELIGHQFQNQLTLRELHLVKYPCMIIDLVLNFFAEPGITFAVNQPNDKEKACPEKTSSFPSRMTFSWVATLVQGGLCSSLKPSDLWSLDPENTLDTIHQKFYQQWVNRFSLRGRQKSIFWPLVKAFGPTYLLAAFLRLVVDMLVFLQLYMIMQVYEFIDRGTVVWHGYLYVGLLLSIYIMKNIAQQQQDYKIKLVDMRVQSALYSAIYKKALRVSHSYRGAKSAADVVNLLTNDVRQLVNLMYYFSNVWAAPIQIVVVFIILWSKLGKAMLAGVGVLLVATLLSLCVAYIIRTLQAKLLNIKDKRLKLMNEVLLGMKAIKLNAWESCFEQKLKNIRKEEINLLKKLNYLQTFSNFIWNVCCTVVLFLSYYMYAKFEDNILDTVVVLGAYLYFMQLPQPFCLLPYAFVEFSQSVSSLKRINEFLNADELSSHQVTRDANEGDSVVIRGGTFSWGCFEPVLHNVTLTVKPGSLVAVVGPVGSGKTSLLAAILGEMDRHSGHISVQESIAYVPQQAWIQNATVRDNILFGNEYEQSWYRKVLGACALDHDLTMLPDADNTLIGDQGTNLSGGQKHRISLARAVYVDKDLYLLDDTLSAFDAVVGRQIFEGVIGHQGLLREKTRIFVTHSRTHLREVDTIVFLKDGEIAELPGTYDELISREGPFSEFVNRSDQQQYSVDALMPALGSQGDVLNLNNKTSSATSVADDSTDSKRENVLPEEVRLLDTNENSQTGRFRLSVYMDYFKSSWGLILFSAVLLVSHHLLIFEALWIVECWGGESKHVKFFENGTCELDELYSKRCRISCKNYEQQLNNTVSSNTRLDDIKTNESLKHLRLFSILGLISAVLLLIVELWVRRCLLHTGLRIHKDMLRGVLMAPLSFLHSTPVGRVITRFTSDINVLDFSFPREVYNFLTCATGMLSTFLLVKIQEDSLANFFLPVFIVYIMLVCYYLTTNRQLRRLEVVSLSSVNSLLSESYLGTTSIRAYNAQERFEKEFDNKVDLLQRFNYHFTVVTLWLNVWLETLGIAVLILTSLYGVSVRAAILQGPEDPEIKPFDGLLIFFASSMIFFFTGSVRAVADIETNIISVERTKEYQDLLPEEDKKHYSNSDGKWLSRGKLWIRSMLQQEEDKKQCSKSSGKWLTRGKLQVKHLNVRYQENQKLVLKDIDFCVEPGQKIGVVGRTGAGKSSLALVLFGVLKPENNQGGTFIDDKDISTIPLKDLRSQLSIIPQDPVLFAGTLRMNLDPMETNRDLEIWEALEKVQALYEFVSQQPSGLDFVVTDGGGNLSMGRKQMICLVRALLRKSKLLIMDEATSSVDLETDELIHEVIREEFRDSTVLIIAHRLNTVLECDKVMVVDNGQIKEYDTPSNLQGDTSSIFHKMVRNAGLIGASGNQRLSLDIET